MVLNIILFLYHRLTFILERQYNDLLPSFHVQSTHLDFELSSALFSVITHNMCQSISYSSFKFEEYT